MIFMIGIGWSESGEWRYKNFTCSKATHEEEHRIMNEFIDFVLERGNPKIYYWHAEKTFWNSAEAKQGQGRELILNNWNNRKWTDLYKLFQEEPIVIKDCFKFGLKSIAKAMRKHGMISTQNESECGNGATAMIRAWKAYSESEDPKNSNEMKDIIKYNEFDCKVLWEILTFLRKNH
jgi:predicted RecB family nuclease